MLGIFLKLRVTSSALTGKPGHILEITVGLFIYLISDVYLWAKRHCRRWNPMINIWVTLQQIEIKHCANKQTNDHQRCPNEQFLT